MVLVGHCGEKEVTRNTGLDSEGMGRVMEENKEKFIQTYYSSDFDHDPDYEPYRMINHKLITVGTSKRRFKLALFKNFEKILLHQFLAYF